MEMDVEETCRPKEKAKPITVILVGAPGSGKSTFCELVMRSSSRPWSRICQDTVNNGKAGTKPQCLKNATSALKESKCVFIDRCNLDREQRLEFVKLGGSYGDVHAVVLDLPSQLCISRSVKRTGHEGNLQGGKAAAVVNRMLQKKELPKLDEGFSRITYCVNEGDVQGAINTYSALGPLDTLLGGCFGQKNRDAKIQLGIMKFLKKVEVPSNVESSLDNIQGSSSDNAVEKDDVCGKRNDDLHLISNPAIREVEKNECRAEGDVNRDISLDDVPTLAFPSISTADFQFNIDKASDIIIETVEKFIDRLENARLVLVDLSHLSNILSSVRDKAAKKRIDSQKFSTFVGDITQLYSKGSLRCTVIANAANWRLKPGGGGVNAAVFSAAGPSLELATKERAKSLLPGHTLVVPLPSDSPLYKTEGVSHVIHVLGPNMNPQRPNCLNNDYTRGCKILREAYTSLFQDFLSIIKSQAKAPTTCSEEHIVDTSGLKNSSSGGSRSSFRSGDQKNKRDGDYASLISKKCKASEDNIGANIARPCSKRGKEGSYANEADLSASRDWGSWAQALYHIAMHPEKHKDQLMEVLDDTVVLNDLYPKAQRHLLVLARCEGLDRLADLREEHLPLLRKMHTVGLKWAEKYLHEDSSLVFRLGYHMVPSMRQLHLHVISQDFNSNHLKNKKHWNSFNTPFFRDSVNVIEEITNHGKAEVNDDDGYLSRELRCHRCRSVHPNIPKLKSHISVCRAPFPPALQEKLVFARNTNTRSDSSPI